MNMELTNISANEYDRLKTGEMSPSMAAAYLRSDHIILRGFDDTLRDMYPNDDLFFRLSAAFSSDGEQASSVTRKLRNWLSGKNRPTNREDIFRIAFALDFTEAQASYLLGLCTDYGIHYREGRDVVYAWFLRTGGGYEEAREFYNSLPPCPLYAQLPQDSRSHLTRRMREDFSRVRTEEELRTLYLANLNSFGMLHTRAYSYFTKYMNQLIHPTTAISDLVEPDYSMEMVMQMYFHLNMPSDRNRTGYDVTQRLVKNNWPNATTLKEIRSRKKDVPRKLLLLLYVVTENVVDQSYSELDEGYISDEERIEDHWLTINAILSDCGMPALDLRNASDWLMMYAVTATDLTMSEQLEQVIECMFSDV